MKQFKIEQIFLIRFKIHVTNIIFRILTVNDFKNVDLILLVNLSKLIVQLDSNASKYDDG